MNPPCPASSRSVGSKIRGYTLLDAITLEPLFNGFAGRSAHRAQFHPTEELLLTDACCCQPDEISLQSPSFFFGLEIWDGTTGDDIGTTGWPVQCGFWYPNGKGFVGYSDRIEFWDLDPQQWVGAACRFAGRNLTQDEWERYGPKDTYRETCS